MKMDIVVIGVNRYSFADRETGEIRKGTTIHYFLTQPLDDENKKGLFPTKATFAYEMYDSLKDKKFPFVTEGNFSLDPTNRTTPFKLVGFDEGQPITI